jgi:hypothetical protein
VGSVGILVGVVVYWALRFSPNPTSERSSAATLRVGAKRLSHFAAEKWICLQSDFLLVVKLIP